MVATAADDVGRLIPARAGKTPTKPQPRHSPTAHPRACGENAHKATTAALTHGSSPRVRGKHGRRRQRPRLRGLIPARAGKTFRSPALSPVARAHPRACGENARAHAGPRDEGRSSPRVRGKRPPLPGPRRRDRLIPARAGKTAASSTGSTPSTAHPRACGENWRRTVRLRPLMGSSPRVRGKLRWNSNVSGWGRLIPARAGKTQFHAGLPPPGGLIPARAGKTRRAGPSRTGCTAHPRACEENPPLRTARSRTGGSSPRVRGKLAGTRPTTVPTGLIPARAGKTWTLQRPAHTGTAHPRACGENGLHGREVRLDPGSSPRVRGKRLQLGEKPVQRGLIPARAGKTAPAKSPARSRRAHPRACGENWANAGKELPFEGSSPRVRGKRQDTGVALGRARLIPARAGKTRRPPRRCP